jgi:hypothetical protein
MIFYGVIFAIGNGLASLTPVGVIVTYAFRGRTGLANAAVISGISVDQAARTRQFWMLLVIYSVCFPDDFFVATHVVAVAQDRGVDSLVAGNLLALMGLTGVDRGLSNSVPQRRTTNLSGLIRQTPPKTRPQLISSPPRYSDPPPTLLAHDAVTD